MNDHVNDYADEEAMRAQVAAGKQRITVGGNWEQIGSLQFEHLRQHGLEPHHKLIDLGCGALRGGVHFVPYLDIGNYYGIDISSALLGAGRRELEATGCADRVPAENLRATDAFDLSGFPPFDFGIAQSLFTHLPAEIARTCLICARQRFAANGRLFATFFIAPSETDFAHPSGIVTHPDRDPFHYSREKVETLAAQAEWKMISLGAWGHPRDQWICEMRPRG